MDKIDNNETKWKTKTFSKDNNNNIIENLETITKKDTKTDENNDTEIIIQKMKKINKKKRTNYKNIEELDNIYDEQPETKKSKKKMENNDNVQENLQENNTEPGKENLQEKDPSKEGFKEELSNQKCKQSALSNFFSKIRYYIGLLNKLLFGNIDKTLSNIIGGIYDMGDKRARSRNGDINIIKNQAYYILSIPVTLFVTYNWVFITIYREGGQKINTDLDFEFIESFIPLLKFFFYYLAVPTFIFNKIVLKDAPSIIEFSKRFKPMDILLTSMLLFLVIIFIIANVVCNYSTKIKNTFFGYIGGSTRANPSLTNMLYGIILFSMLMSLFPTNVSDTVSSYFNLITAPVSTLFGGLFKLIFTMINIGIAGIFLLGYIIIHSFFAIPIYSTTDFKTTIQNINEFLYNSVKNIGMNECPPNTMAWWIKILKILLEIIYKCLYEFIFVLFFFIGLITYLFRLKSGINKMLFSVINLLIISGISLFAYVNKIKDMLEKTKTD